MFSTGDYYNAMSKIILISAYVIITVIFACFINRANRRSGAPFGRLCDILIFMSLYPLVDYLLGYELNTYGSILGYIGLIIFGLAIFVDMIEYVAGSK